MLGGCLIARSLPRDREEQCETEWRMQSGSRWAWREQPLPPSILMSGIGLVCREGPWHYRARRNWQTHQTSNLRRFREEPNLVAKRSLDYEINH